MEIDRPAATVVNEAQAAAPQKAESAPTAQPSSTFKREKPLSFKDVEDMPMHDLDSMKGDQAHTKGEADDEEDIDLEDEDFDDDDSGDDGEEGSEEEGESDEEEDSEPEESEDSDEDADGSFDFEKVKKEFDKDGNLTVKVNGENRKLSLEQAKNFIASGWHTRDKWQQLESEKKTWGEQSGRERAEIAFANSKITPIWENIKAKNIEGAILGLASASNLNSLDVRRQLREQLAPVVYQRLGLNQDQVSQLLKANEGRNAYLDGQEEVEFYRNESERLRTEREKAAQPDPNKEAVEKFRQLQTEHGISNGDLRWAVDFQQKNAQEGQQPDLRGETLVELVVRKRRCDMSIDAITAVRPRLVKDQKFVDRTVKKAIENPTWTTSDLSRWVYKQARAMNDPAKKATALAKDISKKALTHRDKRSFESPTASRKQPQKFSDLGEDDPLY